MGLAVDLSAESRANYESEYPTLHKNMFKRIVSSIWFLAAPKIRIKKEYSDWSVGRQHTQPPTTYCKFHQPIFATEQAKLTRKIRLLQATQLIPRSHFEMCVCTPRRSSSPLVFVCFGESAGSRARKWSSSVEQTRPIIKMLGVGHCKRQHRCHMCSLLC